MDAEIHQSPATNIDHKAVNEFMLSFGYTWDDFSQWWYNEGNITISQKNAVELYERVQQEIAKAKMSAVDEALKSIAYYSAMSGRATVKVHELLDPGSGVVSYTKKIAEL